MQPKPRSTDAPAGAEGPRIPQVDHALRRRRRAGAQQADGARGAGRLRHDAPYRRHAGRACAMPTASGRAWCTGSTRTPPAACWSPRPALPRRPRQDFSLALGAQDLLGAGRRRAEAAAGPHLDLSRQRGASRRNRYHAHRQHGEKGAEPRRDLLCGGGNRRRRSWPGYRSSR